MTRLGTSPVLTIWALISDAVVSEVDFGGARLNITEEKIFLYHEVVRHIASNNFLFFDYVDDCGFSGPDISGDVEQKLADLRECIVDCVACVRSQ